MDETVDNLECFEARHQYRALEHLKQAPKIIKRTHEGAII
jgi:hypothetical protein